MLKDVTVRFGYGPTDLTLSFWNSDNGYLIEDMTNLGPVKSNISTTDYADFPGSRYQSSRRGDRNIVLTLGLEPGNLLGKTVEQLREDLYRYFPMDKELELVFTYEDPALYPKYIRCHVESADPSIFDKDTKFVISLICPDPDFRTTYLDLYSPTHAQLLAGFTVNYAGIIPVGFNLQSTLPDDLEAPYSLVCTPTGREAMTLGFNNSVRDGGLLEINTLPGERFAKFKGESLLATMYYWSKWPVLYPGNNVIKITGTFYGTPTHQIRVHRRFGAL